MKNKTGFITSAVTAFLLVFVTYGCTGYDLTDDSITLSEHVKRGEQLVNEARCHFCHTPSREMVNGEIPADGKILYGHPEDEGIPEIPGVPVGSQQWMEFLANLDSTVWAGPWGISFAANITPDRETGIGSWDEETFIRTMRTGRHAGIDRKILEPMPWEDYRQLSDEHIASIFKYLQTIRPVRNDVPPPIKLNH